MPGDEVCGGTLLVGFLKVVSSNSTYMSLLKCFGLTNRIGIFHILLLLNDIYFQLQCNLVVHEELLV